ncbi:hypothetical protein GUI12_03500 [Anaplasmataceae bacterium AB001_6]|nr:hypothetical protein GUI12_03500 [Anaplasmataceae bacterium AB001_6]
MISKSKHNVSYFRIAYEDEYPINLVLIKDYLGISHNITIYDCMLQEISWIALDYAELYIEKSLIKQNRIANFRGKIPSRVDLNFGPVSDVQSIIGYKDGVEINLVVGIDFFFDCIDQSVKFFNLFDLNEISIKYSAGYGQFENQSMPSSIKQGLMQHIEFIYNKSHDQSFFNFIRNFYSYFKDYNFYI